MVLETGKPIAEVARDLEINDGTLGNWLNIWRRENPEPVPDLNPVERARVKEMEDEIRRLRMENEFLKKQRPSSHGRSRSRALRCDRRGEGQLQNHFHVPAAAGAAVELLRLDQPGGDSDEGPPAGAGGPGGREFAASRQTSGCRRITAALNRRGIECSVGGGSTGRRNTSMLIFGE
jgi:transposase-like protein